MSNDEGEEGQEAEGEGGQRAEGGSPELPHEGLAAARSHRQARERRPGWDFGLKAPQHRPPHKQVYLVRQPVRQRVVRTVQVQLQAAVGPASPNGPHQAAAAGMQQGQQAITGVSLPPPGVSDPWTLRIDVRFAMVRQKREAAG